MCVVDAGSCAQSCAAFPHVHHQWARQGEGGGLCSAEGAVLCWQPWHGHCWTQGEWFTMHIIFTTMKLVLMFCVNHGIKLVI